jgi:hypothetical protein
MKATELFERWAELVRREKHSPRFLFGEADADGNITIVGQGTDPNEGRKLMHSLFSGEREWRLTALINEGQCQLFAGNRRLGIVIEANYKNQDDV